VSDAKPVPEWAHAEAMRHRIQNEGFIEDIVRYSPITDDLARALAEAYRRGREDAAKVEEPGKPDTLKQAKRRVFDTAGTYQVLDVAHDIMRERGMFMGDDGEARRVAAFRERVEAEDAMDEAIVAYAQALRDAAATRAGGASS